MKIYLDTNVLVYAMNDSEPGKQEIAIHLVEQRGCISEIVLNEFCNVAFRKLKFNHEQVTELVMALSEELDVLKMNVASVLGALTLYAKYGYAYYDSLHLAICLQNNLEYFLSKDLQDGQQINLQGNSLRIQNPFLNA